MAIFRIGYNTAISKNEYFKEHLLQKMLIEIGGTGSVCSQHDKAKMKLAISILRMYFLKIFFF